MSLGAADGYVLLRRRPPAPAHGSSFCISKEETFGGRITDGRPMVVAVKPIELVSRGLENFLPRLIPSVRTSTMVVSILIVGAGDMDINIQRGRG